MKSKKQVQKITGQIKATVIRINAVLEYKNTKKGEELLRWYREGMEKIMGVLEGSKSKRGQDERLYSITQI